MLGQKTEKVLKQFDHKFEVEKYTGKVKWIDFSKYGFLTASDGREYFVHRSEIKDFSLKKDDPVTFSLKTGSKGPIAINIKKVDVSFKEK